MRKFIVWLIVYFVVFQSSVFSAENSIKLKYNPSSSEQDRQVEVIISDTLQGNDKLIAEAYGKLKDMKETGRLDYRVPDASWVDIVVSYHGETISSSNSLDVPKLPGYEKYQQQWEAVYEMVWGIASSKLTIKKEDK